MLPGLSIVFMSLISLGLSPDGDGDAHATVPTRLVLAVRSGGAGGGASGEDAHILRINCGHAHVF